ncbi:O-antigen ligase family protein [Comamonas aquatica]|uniref:O-antigen ligase family protein n=1 Tax=Comamonas aquatica TaxID=225991 RepID=A0AA42W219_9BURK|nr:O-antigen ligase family protein [Comamonas aquatica]MDH1430291.1 O-antigen ligase family protein [Comamonas aquatica]MDH1605865.1 O-antigen ligase family protein [Comamonas aquatica]MDH1617805.1 O-antigen ligase family protein [Comamonas aquatica]MDH2005825.1 O-antigen ligase family protein [Comamonas aquatica]
MYHFYNIYKALAIFTAVASFVIPGKFFLWPELHQSICALLAIILFSLKKNKVIKIDFFFYFILFFISFIFINHIFLKIQFHSYFIVGCLYLIFSFFAYSIGKDERLNIILETSSIILIFVTSISFIIQVYQLYGWSEDYGLIMNHYDHNQPGRPYANIAQPNILASIYIFSSVILFWSYVEGLIKKHYIITYTLFLIIGIAITYSRTAYLSLILIVLISFFQKNKFQKIYFSFILTACLLTHLAFQKTSDTSRNLTENLNNGRFDIWKMSFEAFLNSPWVGYGFNESGRAHFQVIENSEFKNIFTAQAHNIFIDFILWFGLPIGLTLSIALIFYFYKILIGSKGKGYLPFLVLLPFAVHSLLEYPLYYANTLMFFSIFIGVASRFYIANFFKSTISIKIFFLILISTFLFSAYFAYECLKMESGLLNQKMYFSRIKGVEKTKTDKFFLADLPKSHIEIIGIRKNEELKENDIKKIKEILHYIVVPRYYWVLLEFYKKTNNQEDFDYWLIKGSALLPLQQSRELRQHYAPEKE